MEPNISLFLPAWKDTDFVDVGLVRIDIFLVLFNGDNFLRMVLRNL